MTNRNNRYDRCEIQFLEVEWLNTVGVNAAIALTRPMAHLIPMGEFTLTDAISDDRHDLPDCRRHPSRPAKTFR